MNRKVNNFREEDYGSDYSTHILEEYKLYVEMADRVSQRRMSANSFFITLNTILITVVGYLIKSENCWLSSFSIIGFLVSLAWYYIISSYCQLNSGKFKVIHKLETFLPISPWTYEWVILGEGKKKNEYWPISHIEKLLPIIFGILYLISGCLIIIMYK